MQLSLMTLFVVLVFLIGFSAFCSGSEIGMMSINRYRLRYLVKQNHKQAIRANQLLSHPDRLLSVILIGNTVVTILMSMLATLIGQRIAGDLGVAVMTFILTLIVLIVSEMIPKTWAALHPQQMAFASAFPLQMIQWLLSPLVRLSTVVVRMFLRLCGVSVDKAQREILSNEELRSIVHEASALLPSEHKSMLVSLLDLEHACVEDIMIPKTDAKDPI